jgi:hypothetical protein
MMNNPCPYLDGIPLYECEIFADGSIKLGFAVAFTRFFENESYLIELFNKLI